MANVTTWSELVSELSRPHADDENVVINLMNDIDMNDVAPLGVSTTQIKCFGRSMVLNGNGHCIKNLRTSISNPQPIFSMADYHYLPTKALNIQNLDFVNLICAGSDFLYDSSNYRQVNFTNCRFVGCRTGHAWLINQSRKITMTSCYFDMPMYAANSTEYSYCSLIKPLTNDELANDGSNLPQAYYCWFHETYGGHKLVSSRSAIAMQDVKITTQCQAFCVHGCYFDGSMKTSHYYNEAGVTTLGVTAYCYLFTVRLSTDVMYTPSTPSVCDITWNTSNSGNERIAKFLNWSGVIKKDVNFNNGTIATSYTSEAYGSGTPFPVPIFATAAQMQNPTWLQSQGFPIIIPTT